MSDEDKAKNKLVELMLMLERTPTVSVGERAMRGILQELLASLQGDHDFQAPDARQLIGYTGPPQPPIYVQATQPVPPPIMPVRASVPQGTPFVSVPTAPMPAPATGVAAVAGAPAAAAPPAGTPPPTGNVNPTVAAQVAMFARPQGAAPGAPGGPAGTAPAQPAPVPTVVVTPPVAPPATPAAAPAAVPPATATTDPPELTEENIETESAQFIQEMDEEEKAASNDSKTETKKPVADAGPGAKSGDLPDPSAVLSESTR